MFCWKCGTKNEAGQKFCSECGALLEVPVDEDGEAGTVMLNKSGEAGTDMLNSSGEAGTDMLNSSGEAGTDMLDQPGETGTDYDGYDDYNNYNGPARGYNDYDNYDNPGYGYDDYDDHGNPGGGYDDYDDYDRLPRRHDGYDIHRSGNGTGQRRSRSSRREKAAVPGRARRMPVAALIIGLLISAAVLAIAALWYFHIGPFALKEESAQQTDQTIAATPTPVLPGLGSSSDTAFPDNSSEGSVSAPAGTPADASAPVVESAPAGESAPVNESVPAGESTSDAWDVW